MTVIKTIAIVNSEGEIWNIYHPGASIIPEGEYEHDKTSTVVHITDVIDHSEFQQTKYYKDGAWKTREKKDNTYYRWKNEAWVLDSDSLFTQIRRERDNRLYACDWTQIGDNKLSMSKQGEWSTYRQALRDVPANNSSVTDFSQVSWPTEPS